MTETPYLRDPYVREFEATVERALDDRVVLDRTHFYPTGGGQPHDTGVLRAEDGSGDRWRVVDVEKRDTIYHTLEPQGETDAPAPGPDTLVAGEIDWERRYGHMRHHTAQHLMSALLLEEYDAETVGNQLYADRARIDVEYEHFDETDLDHIQAAMNGFVDEARPVRWYELDRDVAEDRLDPERTRIGLLPNSITEVRIVEIGHLDDEGPTGAVDPDVLKETPEPLDRTACAGTHVENTEELGEVTITGRQTQGSERERVRFELGEPPAGAPLD